MKRSMYWIVWEEILRIVDSGAVMDMLCAYIGKFGPSPSALIYLREMCFLLASIRSRM